MIGHLTRMLGRETAADRQRRLDARLAELRAEAAAAETARLAKERREACKGCGCTKSKPCVVVISEDEGGVCARITGTRACTECLQKRPARRRAAEPVRGAA